MSLPQPVQKQSSLTTKQWHTVHRQWIKHVPDMCSSKGSLMAFGDDHVPPCQAHQHLSPVQWHSKSFPGWWLMCWVTVAPADVPAEPTFLSPSRSWAHQHNTAQQKPLAGEQLWTCQVSTRQRAKRYFPAPLLSHFREHQRNIFFLLIYDFLLHGFQK